MTKRLLIVGSRNWDDRETIRAAIERYTPGMIVHGGALGADTIANDLAKVLGIPVACFNAHWNTFGKRARSIRNQAMLTIFEPTQVIAFLLNDSVGTWDMINKAIKMGVPVEIYNG